MKILRRSSVLLLLILILSPSLAASAAEKPALVVVISVDQMRSDYLERFRPYFGKDGFNRFLERGAQFPQAQYRHAVTFTGPGHASIGTGLDPRSHGIIANRWYSLAEGHGVYCSEDPGAQWVGAPDNAKKIPILPASPLLLAGSSLGDRLKEAYPAARVVGLALKDRAAVLMAGRKADAALWFEERFARFVSSTYYPSHPSLFAFNERLPAFLASHKVWEVSGKIPATDLARITFDPPELFDSKNPSEGMLATFPHPLSSPRQVVSSPFGDELLLDLARFVVAEMRLGHAPAGAPDLLFLGMSSTDYYGHMFGPDSKEIADGIVRLDAALDGFFGWLDSNVGKDRVLLFLTGDHGVQPIPQVTRAKARLKTGKDDPSLAGRVDLSDGRGPAATIYDGAVDRFKLELFLGKKYKYRVHSDRPNATEGMVAFFDEPCLYLNRPAIRRRGLSVETVKKDVREWVYRLPGVLAAYTNTDLINGLPPSAPHALAVERSFRADRSGDVFVILKPGWMWSYGGDSGTTHGQPNEDDARVPVLAWGPGVKAGSWEAKVSPLSIARTIGALFGLKVGEPDAEVLDPVLGKELPTEKSP